eukprot:gb/GFBE01024780.1/.p1 GENE.gb/GFBE01024780.1/~~gb/GFBE01024780.1/.p1  ORF type:complete len:184 (+),score=29.00 gb/GFBE01024780.1/:1-552(+)
MACTSLNSLNTRSKLLGGRASVSGKAAGAVALWQCCACGREWRADSFAGDDVECCPFAPKVMTFGARSAWGPAEPVQMDSDDDEDEIPDLQEVEKVSKVSKISTSAGSRSSYSGVESMSSPGGSSQDAGSRDGSCRGHDLEAFALAFAAASSSGGYKATDAPTAQAPRPHNARSAAHHQTVTS